MGAGKSVIWRRGWGVTVQKLAGEGLPCVMIMGGCFRSKGDAKGVVWSQIYPWCSRASKTGQGFSMLGA